MTLDPLVLSLVLAAALLHATWNALVKAGGDRLAVMALVSAAPGLVAAPALFFLPPMNAAAVPWLLSSVALHIVYAAALLLAYRHGDLSQVYPIARGSAPGLVALGAWLLAGEAKTPMELLALAVLSLGIMALAWRPRGAVRRAGDRHALGFALLTGLCIAGYSLSDGLGARASEARFTYIAWLFLLDALPVPLYFLWVRRGQAWTLARRHLAVGLGGGLISLAAYGIVIWAMSVAPMAQVVALRETSVLFAALIGTQLMAEPFGRRRLTAACVIVMGAALLQVGRGL